MIADYASQADSIYTPQLQAEQGTLSAENAANGVTYAANTAAANSAYTDALKTAGTNRDTASAHGDFVAQTHGLFNSGLAANAQRLTYDAYQQNADRIAQDRADKLTNIANTKSANDTKYQASLGALTSKYAGLKNQYIISQQDAEAKAQAANAAKIQAAQIRAASKAAPDPAKGYGMTRNTSQTNTDPIGSLSFHGAHGEPISAGAYLDGISGGQAGTKDLAQLLSQGTADDQKIAKSIGSMSVAQAKQNYPWLFQ